MKPKDYCQECGKFMCKKKLKKDPKDERLLCGNCFKRLAGIRLVKEPIVPIMNNSTKSDKKAVRMAKIRRRCNYIDRSDVDFLKNKHGSEGYGKIKKLFKYLGVHRTKDILDNSESVDRQKREMNLNNKLIKGLK